ncbi:MAG: hypothetical protein Q9181_004079 [Wetmoreana brouardii]
MASDGNGAVLPDGIFSILDTDLYKLTMQCAILKYLPDVHVTYAFTNRTPHMRLSRAAYQWLQEQIDKLANVSLTYEELEYLKNTCTYFNDTYLQFLHSFRLRPSKHVRATFTPLNNTGSQDDMGDVHLDIGGRWLDTILYEIPLLALTSEAYFKFCDRDWNYKHQEERAHVKGCKLIENGCIFSEFGSRRRRDYHTQDLVIQGLKRAAADGRSRGWKGKLSGTSNVHFAMKYDIAPVGTVAHEWFMGVASITNDYEHANETALRYWVGCFGEGVLGIALTDTFGTPIFLKAFKRIMPTPANSMADDKETLIPGAASPPTPPMDGVGLAGGSEERSYARIFQGVRQDSGDPIEFIKIMRDFYHSEGIQEQKTIVFSDSLNIELCLEYMHAAEEAGFAPTFDDFTHISSDEKSVPLNIVIKLSSANGHPAIKISDNIGKNTGDSETVHKVKETLGYVEQQWANGDETTRWDDSGIDSLSQPLRLIRTPGLSDAFGVDPRGTGWLSAHVHVGAGASNYPSACINPETVLWLLLAPLNSAGDKGGKSSDEAPGGDDNRRLERHPTIHDYHIIPDMSLSFLLKFLRDQLFVTLPYPEKPATDQTIIVTGGNVGLGFEAARHYVRLGAAKVILAVRTVEKGESAKKEIETSEKRQGVVEVWKLDLSSYDSVKQFARKVHDLPRLDILLENAGILTPQYRLTEDNESTITTNVVSTFLLALIVLPKLRESAAKYKITPHLTVVTSEVHFMTDFPEKSSEDIFATLNDKENARMNDRYQVSKLLEVFYGRELAARISKSDKPDIIFNLVNPGFCHSELGLKAGDPFALKVMKFFLARTTEEGSRNYHAATSAGPESHGQYVNACKVDAVAPLVTSQVGVETQAKVWEQLSSKLEKIQPGVMANI